MAKPNCNPSFRRGRWTGPWTLLASQTSLFELQARERFYIKNQGWWGWRASSAVLMTLAVLRGFGFNSQHPHDSWQPSVNSSSRGFNNLFWPLWTLGMHKVHRHTCRHNAHAHKMKFKIKKTKRLVALVGQHLRLTSDFQVCTCIRTYTHIHTYACMHTYICTHACMELSIGMM